MQALIVSSLLIALLSPAFGFQFAHPLQSIATKKLSLHKVAINKQSNVFSTAKVPTYFKSLELAATANELENFGDDIQILPPSNGAVKIVMKFGGSSLATPERVTYVSK